MRRISLATILLISPLSHAHQADPMEGSANYREPLRFIPESLFTGSRLPAHDA